MPGFVLVELVERQRILALHYLDVCQIGRHGDRTAHTAVGTIAPAYRVQAIAQP